MEAHHPDRIALVFGLLFTTVGVVSIADLTDIASIDAGVVAGVALVGGAVMIVATIVTKMLGKEVAEPDATDQAEVADPA